ncbi:uncharacterized protein LOC120073021 [Benincasa hispida]|uniref:uncharacterized protein LOC120073021 n=1 Tax=Benincasa hispida TaxID=102211 RepID=UPI001900C832|nr:uncharacterized protein LOC120073021 [Benincasa hispida]
MSNSIIQLLASDKFNGEGYSNWKSNLNTILVVDDPRFVLTEECPPISNLTANRSFQDAYDMWVRVNEKARAYILVSIFDVFNKKHEAMPTTHEIMASLQDMFEQLSSSIRHEAIKYVYNSGMKDGTNIREHVLDMLVHFNVAEAHRATIDETSQTYQSMMKLKESEANVVSRQKKFLKSSLSRTKPPGRKKNGGSWTSILCSRGLKVDATSGFICSGSFEL